MKVSKTSFSSWNSSTWSCYESCLRLMVKARSVAVRPIWKKPKTKVAPMFSLALSGKCSNQAYLAKIETVRDNERNRLLQMYTYYSAITFWGATNTAKRSTMITVRLQAIVWAPLREQTNRLTAFSNLPYRLFISTGFWSDELLWELLSWYSYLIYY